MKNLFTILLIIPLVLHGQIDSIVKTKINHESENPVHSILIYVENLDKDFQKVSKNDQFRIASITKLFVSAIILQLAEEGKLSLKDKASQYTENIGYLNFDNFHMYKEKNYSNEINIEQHLSHRSGLADIFSDKKQEFFSYLLQNPKRQFSPRSIVELYY